MDENTSHPVTKKVSLKGNMSTIYHSGPPPPSEGVASTIGSAMFTNSNKLNNMKASRLKHLMRNKSHAPNVWARIRPSLKFQDNVFKVDETGKRLCVKLDDPSNNPNIYNFPTDGILYNSSQDETFTLLAHDLIEKAFLRGVSSLFITLGPELTGKNFTLFGIPGKYDHRGLIPRTIDQIFNTAEKRPSDNVYHIFISAVQVHQNHIRDLVTMTQYNIDYVGVDGPCQKFMHQVYNRDEAGAILHRIFVERGKGKQNSPEKCHTFIYFDILTVGDKEKGPAVRKFRITFVRIASIPTRKHAHKTYGIKSAIDGKCYDGCPCVNSFPNKKNWLNDVVEKPPLPFVIGGKCCHRRERYPSCTSTDDNNSDLRRDLFFLNQLFARSNLLRKLHLMQLKRPDLLQTHFKDLHIAPSQYFRQCKLTHLLKDMSKGNTEIRIIIHVRPEEAHISTTLEALSFAKRAKGIPVLPKYNTNKEKHHSRQTHRQSRQYRNSGNRNKINIEESLLNTLLKEEPGADVTIELSPYQMRMISQQISRYFEEKLKQDKVEEKPTFLHCEKIEPLRIISMEPSKEAWDKISQQSHFKLPVTVNSDEIDSNPKASLSQFIAIKQKEDKEKERLKETEDNHKTIETENTNGRLGDRKKSVSVKVKNIVEQGAKDNNNQNTGKEENEHAGDWTEDTKESAQSKMDPKSKSGNKKGRKGKENKISKSDSKKKTETKKERRKSIGKVKTTQDNRLSSIVTSSNDPSPDIIPPTTKSRKRKYKRGEEHKPVTVQDAWHTFVQTPAGHKIYSKLQHSMDRTSKLVNEKSSITKYAANLLQKISSAQNEIENFKLQALNIPTNSNMSDFEQKRSYDIKIMQLSRDPLLVRLNNMKTQLRIQKNNSEVDRKSCESAFQIYAKDNLGLDVNVKEIPVNIGDLKTDSSNNIPKSKISRSRHGANSGNKFQKQPESPEDRKAAAGGFVSFPAPSGRRTRSLPDDLIENTNSKQYNTISHAAHIQAKLLRKINYYKPQWVKYY